MLHWSFTRILPIMAKKNNKTTNHFSTIHNMVNNLDINLEINYLGMFGSNFSTFDMYIFFHLERGSNSSQIKII